MLECTWGPGMRTEKSYPLGLLEFHFLQCQLLFYLALNIPAPINVLFASKGLMLHVTGGPNLGGVLLET